MPLDLLNHKLVLSLDLLVACADNELFVAAEHADRGLERLNAVMVTLVTTALVSCQGVTPLALDHGLANRELVRWQENPWHHTSTMVAGHF